MARARYQEGTLGIEGKRSADRYYTRFRIYDSDGNSKRKQVTLGLVSKLSKREANKRRAENRRRADISATQDSRRSEGRDDS
jgi:hypothetical protein